MIQYGTYFPRADHLWAREHKVFIEKGKGHHVSEQASKVWRFSCRVVDLTNWRPFFMRLSCYWSWISSSHCQRSCGSADYFDNVMTKFMINNRTDVLKTDINLFFTITNCRIARSRSLTRRINFKFMSVRILTIKISQWARVNFCSYRKIFINNDLLNCAHFMMSQIHYE